MYALIIKCRCEDELMPFRYSKMGSWCGCRGYVQLTFVRVGMFRGPVVVIDEFRHIFTRHLRPGVTKYHAMPS